MSDPVREARLVVPDLIAEGLRAIPREVRARLSLAHVDALTKPLRAALDRERKAVAQAREIVETLGRSPLDDGSVLVLDTDWRALRRALKMEVRK